MKNASLSIRMCYFQNTIFNLLFIVTESILLFCVYKFAKFDYLFFDCFLYFIINSFASSKFLG